MAFSTPAAVTVARVSTVAGAVAMTVITKVIVATYGNRNVGDRGGSFGGCRDRVGGRGHGDGHSSGRDGDGNMGCSGGQGVGRNGCVYGDHCGCRDSDTAAVAVA